MLKQMITCVLGVAACASATPISQLPSVDAMREHLQMIGVDRISARLQICIDPDGTSLVHVLRSSGVSYFDRALVADVSTWHRQPSAGLRGLCEPLTVTYVP